MEIGSIDFNYFHRLPLCRPSHSLDGRGYRLTAALALETERVMLYLAGEHPGSVVVLEG